MEENAYQLGTEKQELHRLGFQHEVWSDEAYTAWKAAGFSQGQHLLDLGCGPGFCSRPLAYIAGERGSVTSVDLSQNYIDFLDNDANNHGLEIHSQCASFDDMLLPDNHFHGAYGRWVLCWISNVSEIIRKIKSSLQPGGVYVAHEYFDWWTLQTEPYNEAIKVAIDAAEQSFLDMDGNINIGRELPRLFKEEGFEIVSIRQMQKIAPAKSLNWYWPKTFFTIYMPKLVDSGYMTNEQKEAALAEFDRLEELPHAMILTPQMLEVIVRKPL